MERRLPGIHLELQFRDYLRFAEVHQINFVEYLRVIAIEFSILVFIIGQGYTNNGKADDHWQPDTSWVQGSGSLVG